MVGRENDKGKKVEVNLIALCRESDRPHRSSNPAVVHGTSDPPEQASRVNSASSRHFRLAGGVTTVTLHAASAAVQCDRSTTAESALAVQRALME